jgi:hypothetical protein
MIFNKRVEDWIKLVAEKNAVVRIVFISKLKGLKTYNFIFDSLI